MITALLLAALAVASLGWVGARASWRAAEEEVLRLCAQLRLAEALRAAYAALGVAIDQAEESGLGRLETPARDSDA